MQRFVVSVVFLVACHVPHPDAPSVDDAVEAGSGGTAAEPAAPDAMTSGAGGAESDVAPDEPADVACTRCGLSNKCCAAGEACVGERCLAPCDGTRCGAADELCCGGQAPLCVRGACVAPGATCASDGECAAAQVCEPLIERCLPAGAPGGTCYQAGGSVAPSAAAGGARAFEPELLWERTGLWASSMPLVVQLNDDDLDGDVDDRDVPDVVAVVRAASPNLANGADAPEYYASYLTTLSGNDGRTMWENRNVVLCGDAPAAADLDGNGRVDIVATACEVRTDLVTRDGVQVEQYTAVPIGIQAFSNYLTPLWGPTRTPGAQAGGVSIADLDADGSPEIIAPPHVYDASGTLKWTMAEGRGTVAIADVDLDGRLELIWGAVAYDDDGTLLWRGAAGADADTMPVVARVLEAPLAPRVPQVMLVSTPIDPSTRQVSIAIDVRDGISGRAVQDLTTVPGFVLPAASLPVLGDFDGDREPEFGIGVDGQYLAIHPRRFTKSTVLWQYGPPADGVHGAGSTAFDFDGDGTLELAVAANCQLRVLSAGTGTQLWSAASGPSTTRGVAAANWGLPVVADVDGDGHADLLVSSADSAAFCGDQERSLSSIRVYRERSPGPGWMPARKLWNQYAYSVDNIADDGEVPRVPAHGWETHNTYRINRTELPPPSPGQSRPGMPDLRVSALSARREHCPSQPTLLARVENQGELGAPAGVAVTFYEGGPTEPGVRLGAVRTLVPLLAGAATWVELGVSDPPLGDAQTLRFFASVDRGQDGASAIAECDEQNNTTDPYIFACSAPAQPVSGGGD
jgi:hypothetical protein